MSMIILSGVVCEHISSSPSTMGRLALTEWKTSIPHCTHARQTLPRIYRFTSCNRRQRGPDSIQASHLISELGSSRELQNSDHAVNASSPPRSRFAIAREEVTRKEELRDHETNQGLAYPNGLQPWKPPLLFQFCKVQECLHKLIAHPGGYTRTGSL